MIVNDLTLRIGGESGEGMVTTGDVFARICARSGLGVYTFRTYPAEILGGHVLFQVRINESQPLSQGDALDVLLAFNQEAYDKHHGELKEDGVLVYDTRSLTPPESIKEIQYGFPFAELSEKIHYIRGKNIVAVGCLVALFDLPMEIAKQVIKKRLSRKGEEALMKNLEALQTGYQYVKEEVEKRDPYICKAITIENDERLVLQGNQAITLGALEAGCDFYGGYPITPASDIMEAMAGLLPRAGGVMVQAEDEIAAITMIVGASYAGKKSMTATSGPGLSLMMEVLGLASMTEIPCVIVNVQRGGPSTGLPTKTSQEDLYAALHGSHGDSPRIVIAPLNVEDAFYQMVQAFNLSEKYQMPCIFLSDQSLSHRVETVPCFPFGKLDKVSRLLPDLDGQEDYLRYKLTESGISPMSFPGLEKGQYTAEGLEHTEDGAPCWDPHNHERMMRKRYKKLKLLEQEIESLKLYAEEGDADAEIGVLTWGSAYGPSLEGVQLAREKGIKVAIFAPKTLSPLPEEKIKKFAQQKKHLIVPEVNYTGQFASLMRSLLRRDVKQLNAYGGLPFSPVQVAEMILASAGKSKAYTKEEVKV